MEALEGKKQTDHDQYFGPMKLSTKSRASRCLGVRGRPHAGILETK
jgi:hypothetical protein